MRDQATTTNVMDRATAIAAGVGVSAVGAVFYNVLPLFLGTAQDFRALTDQQIGLLSSAFFAGFTLAAASAFFWVRRLSWTATSLAALPATAIFLVLGSAAPNHILLLLCIVLAGAGLGTVYGIGTTALGDTSNPARWYGVKIAAEAGTGAFLLFFLPATVVKVWGFTGLLLTLAIVIVLFTPISVLLPGHGIKSAEHEAGTATGGHVKPLMVWAALVGCMLFMAGQTTVWAFVERIGSSVGHDPVAVGQLLALTLVFALSGSFSAAWIGGRFATVRPLAFASFCFFVAIVLLTQADNFSAYAIGACTLMFSVGFGLTFAVTTVANLDYDGRYVVLTVPAIGIGLMAGPGIAGYLTRGAGFMPVLVFSGLLVATALAAFLFSVGRGSVASVVNPL